MGDSNFNSESLVFKELPKEQQHALRKEFTSQTKWGKKLLIVFIVISLIAIAIAINNFFTSYRIFLSGVFPICYFPIFVALNEEAFVKWLKSEKNIVIKKNA